MNINLLIKEMECFAREENIPIMLPEGIDFICSFIKDNDIKTVLEIGTAIGYSAIRMANLGPSVLSIERDEERYKMAQKNVQKAGMNDKIQLFLSDAFDTDIKETFDLILIDAAKGKNIEFIDKFKKNLKQNGFIIIDNVDFHGLVHNSEEIKSRRLKSLVRKIEKFLMYLEDQNEFNVTKIDKGDGLIILSNKEANK